MPHTTDYSMRSDAIASRRLDNPGTRRINEGYDPKHSCRTCVNLVNKDGLFGCGLDLLGGRKYGSTSGLNGTYPRNVAAACQRYSKKDRVSREEG